MWPREEDTQNLLDEVREGSERAVNALLARHREALRRVVDLRLDPVLARRVDASDIVQEAMLEASSRLADYAKEPPMPFHLWLRRIALDRLIDAHRRHRQAQKRSIDREQRRQVGERAYDDRSSLDLILQLKDDRLTPAAEAMREELSRRLCSALEQLSEGDREIILMRHFEQLTNSDVAGLLGLTEAAAGMRHIRALRRLRTVLGDELAGT